MDNLTATAILPFAAVTLWQSNAISVQAAKCLAPSTGEVLVRPRAARMEVFIGDNVLSLGGTSSKKDADNNSFWGSVSVTHLNQVQKLFFMPRPGEVFGFINSEIERLLIDMESELREYFEGNTALSVEIRTDPESFEDVLLVLVHSSSLNWREAEERLEKFDRNWWFRQRWSPSSKRICVDLA